MSMVSPMERESMCWDNMPPWGNLGWVLARYTLITKDTVPGVSFPDTGV